MTDGAVWKFDRKDNVWTNITPLKSPDAGGRSVTARSRWTRSIRATIMVTTFAHWHPHDLIFRSTDGGAHLDAALAGRHRWDHSSAPYTKTRTPHWMGSIAINPHNSDQVLFVTGYGIWSSVNARQADSGKPTRWFFWMTDLRKPFRWR